MEGRSDKDTLLSVGDCQNLRVRKTRGIVCHQPSHVVTLGFKVRNEAGIGAFIQ